MTVMTDRTPGSLENGVLFGRDGHLFLADGGHAVLDFALGKRVVSSQSISAFSDNIGHRRQTAAAHGIPYVHVIFPDKQSVLTNSFPFPDPVCLGEIYLQAAPAIADWVLYPRQILRSAGDKVFQRTDTHLTDLGTAAVARCVLDRLFARSHAAEFERIGSAITNPQEWIGDLGRRFTPELREIRLTFRAPNPLRWYHNNITGGNNGLVDLIFNASAIYDKRLLIFGDSFGRELARFLSLFVQEITFLRTPFFHQEMFEQIAPDLLITDNVERYLSACTSDENRPSFLLYPFLGSGDYAPSREFCEAFSAVLSYPRKPYEDLRASMAL